MSFRGTDFVWIGVLIFLANDIAFKNHALSTELAQQEAISCGSLDITGRLTQSSNRLQSDNSFRENHLCYGLAGEVITFELSSSDFDTYLIIAGPSGEWIEQDDDGGEGTNSRIAITLPESGDYTVIANSYAVDEVGEYYLSGRTSGSFEASNMEPIDSSESPEDLRERGIATRDRREYTESEQIWRLVIAEDLYDAFAHENLGFVLIQLKNYSEAEIYLRRAIALDPDDNEWTYYSLGNALRYQEKYEEAEEAYRNAITINSSYAPAYSGLGDLLRDQGKYEEAETAYRKAIDIDPADVDAYLGLSYSFLIQNQYEAAESISRQAVAANPDSAAAYTSLGNSLWYQDKDTEAEQAYRQAITLNPRYEAAYERLGILLRYYNRHREAREIYEQALNLESDSETVQNGIEEAERSIAIEESSPEFGPQYDISWVPTNEPLRDILRAVVKITSETKSGTVIGTGWVIKREGNSIWILTNRHVVSEGTAGIEDILDEVSVDFYSIPPDGQPLLRMTAEVVESTEISDDLDLALLKVDNAPNDIEPLLVGDSTQVNLKQEFTVIGHPTTELSWSVDIGLISNQDSEIFQISRASFGPRSSGGPILDDQNQVLGIVFEVIDARAVGTSAGYGLAYRVDYISPILRRWGML